MLSDFNNKLWDIYYKKGYNKQMGKRIEQYQVQVISLIKIWAKNLRCLKCDSPF